MSRHPSGSIARAIEGGSLPTSRTARIPVDPVEEGERRAELASLPSEPCFRCGARGWCGHDGRTPDETPRPMPDLARGDGRKNNGGVRHYRFPPQS